MQLRAYFIIVGSGIAALRAAAELAGAGSALLPKSGTREGTRIRAGRDAAALDGRLAQLTGRTIAPRRTVRERAVQCSGGRSGIVRELMAWARFDRQLTAAQRSRLKCAQRAPGFTRTMRPVARSDAGSERVSA